MGFANMYSPFGVKRQPTAPGMAPSAPSGFVGDSYSMVSAPMAPGRVSAPSAPMMSQGQSAPSFPMSPAHYDSRPGQTAAIQQQAAASRLKQADYAMNAPMFPQGPSHTIDGQIIPGSQERNQQSMAAGRSAYVSDQTRRGTVGMAPFVNSQTYTQDQQLASMAPGMYQQQADDQHSLAQAQADSLGRGAKDYQQLQKNHEALQRSHDALTRQLADLTNKLAAQKTGPATQPTPNVQLTQDSLNDRQKNSLEEKSKLADQERVDKNVQSLQSVTGAGMSPEDAGMATAKDPRFKGSSATQPYNYKSPEEPGQPAQDLTPELRGPIEAKGGKINPDGTATLPDGSTWAIGQQDGRHGWIRRGGPVTRPTQG